MFICITGLYPVYLDFNLDGIQSRGTLLSEKRESNPRNVALQATPNPLGFSHSLFPHLDSNQEPNLRRIMLFQLSYGEILICITGLYPVNPRRKHGIQSRDTITNFNNSFCSPTRNAHIRAGDSFWIVSR
jgi:hypothetical protein